MTPTGEQPAPAGPRPLEYADPDLDRLTITRDEATLLVRVPPLRAGRFVARVMLWALGFTILVMACGRELWPGPAPRYVFFLTGHASLLPLPVRAVAAAVCGLMVLRIWFARGSPAALAMDEVGLLITDPSAFFPRRRIPFDRLAEVRVGDVPRVEVYLRDGPLSLLPLDTIANAAEVTAAVKSAVNDAVEAAKRRGSVRPAPDRGTPLRSTRPPPKAWMPDDWPQYEYEYFPDGVRVTAVHKGAPFGLSVVRALLLMFGAAILVSLVPGVRVNPFDVVRWTAVFAVTVFVIYSNVLRKDWPRGATTVLDVVGRELQITDPNYRGTANWWPAGEVVSLDVGGPLWWILRVGSLRLRLRDRRVTLLYGYPVRDLAAVAAELRAALAPTPDRH